MAEPKRIQVRDRFYDVLSSIRAEDGYHYTPDLVAKNFNEFQMGAGKIKLTALPDEGGEIVNHSGAVDETFYMLVVGHAENQDDPVLVAERVLNDVRVAVDVDSRIESSTALGGICLQVVMDESANILHEMAMEGITRFTQRFRCMITAADFLGL